MQGLAAHDLVVLRPVVDEQLERKMPLVACRLCGLAGAARASSFSGDCKLPPSAAGSAVVAKLRRGPAPRTAKVAPV
eukprot:6438412-Pyramimonas_sp.AAC.1